MVDRPQSGDRHPISVDAPAHCALTRLRYRGLPGALSSTVGARLALSRARSRLSACMLASRTTQANEHMGSIPAVPKLLASPEVLLLWPGSAAILGRRVRVVL